MPQTSSISSRWQYAGHAEYAIYLLLAYDTHCRTITFHCEPITPFSLLIQLILYSNNPLPNPTSNLHSLKVSTHQILTTFQLSPSSNSLPPTLKLSPLTFPPCKIGQSTTLVSLGSINARISYFPSPFSVPTC